MRRGSLIMFGGLVNRAPHPADRLTSVTAGGNVCVDAEDQARMAICFSLGKVTIHLGMCMFIVMEG